MAAAEDGRIVTFYSSTGGTGRSMALANVACILASNGLRVLAADWDLESPGLDRYFHPFFSGSEVSATQGIVDLLNDYVRAIVLPGQRPRGWHVEYAKVLKHAFSIRWDNLFPGGGTLDYLSAGRTASEYPPSYWEDFYKQVGLRQFLDALRADMKRNYDYVLIDGQAGLNDTATVCAEAIPDVVVACFVLSGHSIDMTAQFARVMLDAEQDRRRHVRILPVPMKVDFAEKSRATAGRAMAHKKFAGFPNGLNDRQQAGYWESAGIPYASSAAFEENLAIFEDRRDPSSLLAAYEWLAGAISDGRVTALPTMDEQLRVRYRDAFTREAL